MKVSTQQKLLDELYDIITDLINEGMNESDIKNAVNQIIRIEL